MTLRSVLRVILGVLFVLAGLNHFRSDMYLKIMPPYLFYPLELVDIRDHGKELVFLSGVFEVLGGVGLLIPRLRKIAGWGLIALLIAVFPANLYMYLDPVAGQGLPTWVLLGRLPLQLVLIAWVWWCMRDDA